MSDALLLWPLAYLVHSTLLLGGAWLASRRVRHPALAEALWRCAFFGAFVTASLQPLAQMLPSRTPAPASPAHVAAPAAARVTPARVQAPEPHAAPVPAAVPPSVSPDRAWRLWLPQQTRLALFALLAAWAVITAAGLLALALQWLALVRACRRLRPNVDAGWTQSLLELVRHYGLPRAPALRVGSAWASPLVGPRGVVCLPDWCLAQLQGTQRDAVLAHELAHLARRDPAWRLAARAAACLGWMQPLNALALRRLDALAEQACDARAARAIADRHAVAQALYACASQVSAGRRAPRLQPGMAATRSPLLRRIEHLMGPQPAQEPRRVSRRGWLLLAMVPVAAACLVPAIAVRGHALQAADWHEWLEDTMPGTGSHVMMRSPDDQVDLWLRGSVALRDDSDELRSGRVTLRETTGGVTRRMDIETATGSAVRRYELDGAPHPLDADMKRWADRRWDMVMGTLLRPGQRVERLLQHGGPEAVMQAIESPADIDTQQALIEAWAGTRTLDERTVQRLIAAADRAEPAGDDHDRVLSLRVIARRQQLGDDQKQQFLAALAARRNDSDAASTLQALLVQLNARTPADILAGSANALRALHSDEQRRESLLQALDAGNATAVELALQVSPSFTSDFDRRDLLEHVAKHLNMSDNGADVVRYADSARRLRSASDRRLALVALAESVPLRTDGCLAVLAALEGMNDPGELTPVLLALARHMPADAALVARYRQVARVLPAFERGQAEQALDALPQPG